MRSKKPSESAGKTSTATTVTPSSAKLVSRTIPENWFALVPSYSSRVYPGLICKLEWNPSYADRIAAISDRRATNRITNYVDPEELQRAAEKRERKGEASIRFGVSKSGHGYSGERGDFCLVGGVIRGKNLTVFYRSLELIGGFAYDLCLFRYIETDFFDFKTVTIMATKANVFALKGNSNEKLYPKLVEIFES
jgi:hypothetical protein